MQKKFKEHTYSVKGMHCASCEVLIEQKLIAIEGVKAVDASSNKGTVFIEYEEGKPAIARLNNLFEKEGYTFSDGINKQETSANGKKIGGSIFIALLIIAGFMAISKLGLTNWMNVSSKSSLPTFFMFGLLAGVSTCAALVGGLILSMSKQWLDLYAGEPSTIKKLQPHIMFNTGRLLSYIFFGSLLGFLGSGFQLSIKFTSFLVIAISVMMFFIGLQMLGIKAFRKLQISLPKSVTRNIANERNFKGKNMPFLMGALTFFLPCGFTIAAQGMALISGNPIQGALIMGSFALGTLLPLLAIGLSSVKISQKPHLAERFSKVAGVLILFFAIYNVNSQLNVLGVTSLSDIKISNTNQTTKIDLKDLPEIVDGKQVIKMTAYASSDSPNYIKVRAGIPVKWEITAANSLGCNGSIISTSLFSGSINLTPGQVSIKEFTPTTPGRYKFSCSMGMISGVIEVVNVSGSAVTTTSATATAITDDANTIPSGASGCSCGGGGSGGTCGGN